MPMFGYSYFWESDPKRWESCRQAAGKQMVSEGWNPKALKFDEVCRRKAMKLWNNK